MSIQRFTISGIALLMIGDCRGSLAVTVWDEAAIGLECDEPLRNLRAEGDSVSLDRADDDLTVYLPADSAIQIRRVQGDLQSAALRSLEVSRVDGDLEVEAVETAQIGAIAGDTEVGSVTLSLRCGTIGGDLAIDDSPGAQISLGTIGGDLRVGAVSALEFGNVGGDAEIGELAGTLTMGRIGGDLELRATLVPGSSSRMRVGGDARLEIGADPNVTIRALVGGEISGVGELADHRMVTLVYGAGAAELDLWAGGDLEIETPAKAASINATNQDWSGRGGEFGRMGEEFGRFGEEFGRMGEELGRKMEQIGQQIGRSASEQVRFQVNGREWTLNRERLDRLKSEAQRAARDGASELLRAFERAFGTEGMPPVPPVPPTPPTPPTPPVTGQTIRIDIEDLDPETRTAAERAVAPPASTTTTATAPDEDRLVILRMVAEGRITPEEGEMLLEAL